MIQIETATYDLDHKELCKIAKTSPYTKDFSAIMFSSKAIYDKGWIRKAVLDGITAGYYCVRHKVRGDKETMLYFITVAPWARAKKVGEALLDDLKAQSPRRAIHLNVAKDNTAAIAFYQKHGFIKAGESLEGHGWRMIWYG